jgi:hypothetical protein
MEPSAISSFRMRQSVESKRGGMGGPYEKVRCLVIELVPAPRNNSNV